MSNSSTNTLFKHGKKSFLDFTETQNETDDITIKEELLILQNGTTVGLSGRNRNEDFLTPNLDLDDTSNYQGNKFIKKEKIDPITERSLDVQFEEKIIQGVRCEIIAQDLKREPTFVSASEGNIGSFVNHNAVSDFFGRKSVYVKQERIESDEGFSNGSSNSENKSNTIAFVKEEVQEKNGEINEKSCSEESRIDCNTDEQYDSFSEEMSGTEEEVNSSDIEEMFNESKIIEKDQPFECLTCGKLFKAEHNLKKHAQSHIEGDTKIAHKFECETCGKNFKLKHHLKRHYLSHTQKKDFSCSHCDKSYIEKHDLIKHMSSNHTAKECGVCGKLFDNYLKLRKHSAVHKKSENKLQTVYDCHICQKTFKKVKYLKRHLQVHAKLTPFTCNLCNKSFLFPFLLMEHTRSHTGEKPFQCDKCDRKFSTKSNLVRHLKTHLKTRIRMCNNCSAEFDDDELFEAHKKTCILSYECVKCGLTCERLSNMRRHVKTHAKYEGSIDSCSDSENIIVRIVERPN